MKRLFSTFSLLTILLFTPLSIAAQNMTKLGSFDVHHMVIGATFLTPKVATTYGIQRSRYNALVNISVLDNTLEKNPAKNVYISGTARNDIGQIKKLDFTEIKEGSAIYYLAQLNFSDEETFYFDLIIKDGKETQQLTFKQKLYVDE